MRRLLSSATLINQAVGDALSDLLFCEAVLRLKGWGCKVGRKNKGLLSSMYCCTFPLTTTYISGFVALAHAGGMFTLHKEAFWLSFWSLLSLSWSFAYHVPAAFALKPGLNHFQGSRWCRHSAARRPSVFAPCACLHRDGNRIHCHTRRS